MTPGRRGSLPLLLVVGVVAVAAGTWVALRAGSGQMRQGVVAPDFVLPLLDGGQARLSAHRGSVLFVNFWATWCAPCKEESPALQRLYAQLEGEGFELLAISVDQQGDEAEVRAFREEFGLSFPILLDPDRDTYQSFQVYGVPETFLIDPQGRMAERFVGPKNWDDPRYARAIRRLLAADETAGG